GAQLEVADARSEDVVHHGGVVVGSTTGCLVRVGGGGIDDSEEPWPPAAAQLEDRGRVAGRVELADELRVPLDERAGEDAAVRRTREAVHGADLADGRERLGRFAQPSAVSTLGGGGGGGVAS